MPNHLAHETSPYLLQHAGNPVDWHPWGAEALERAKSEERPIFLSIGYSACHWCHVMEHESFEDERIAHLLNENFVSIKVDREERPDLDQIYMSAVQVIAGRGGWPMSVFLTPDLQPFFGGTYWPPTARTGMPGFDQILAAVIDAWQNRREQTVAQARQLTEQLAAAAPGGSGGKLSAEPLRAAEAALERTFDHRHGGFGGAPKFPHPMDLRVLLRRGKRGADLQSDSYRGAHLQSASRQVDNLPHAMVAKTLDHMAAGGIYDHLAGGFHRYSVDERWLVPHFEKMLYDNALLAACYVEAFQATGNADYEAVARETLDYILRDMTDPQGGFYSTQDADTEGEEGKTYVWSPEEVERVLGAADAKAFCYIYDVSPEGNFEGHNILNRPKTWEQCGKILGRDEAELRAAMSRCREALLQVRNQRPQPGLDDKVLASWNALAIDALALAAGAFDEPRYLAAAARAAEFIRDHLRRDDGRLLHGWRQGQARHDAYLDDYAYLANALVTLYEAGGDERWIDEAMRLAETMLARFADREHGGFFFTADDHETLIVRHKDAQDASVPSGNAMAATALLRLGKLTGRADFLDAAERTLAAFVELMERYPTAAGQMLLALDFRLGPAPEIVVLGGDSDEEAAAASAALVDVRRRFLPNKVLAGRVRPRDYASPHLAELFAGKTPLRPGPTVYVCESFACQAPVHGAAATAAFDALER